MKIISKFKSRRGGCSSVPAPKIIALSLAFGVLSFAVGCQSGGYSEITSAEDADPARANRARAIPRPDADGPQAELEEGLEFGTCRPGSTFRTISGEAANPKACRDICRDLMNCMAFTSHTEPDGGARCELKHSVAEPVADSGPDLKGCVSWVNPRANAQMARLEAQGFELRSGRPGENMREFEMDRPDPALCQHACENLRDCAAFTYTRPGYDGEAARCALKTQVEAAISNQDCCISGVK